MTKEESVAVKSSWILKKKDVLSICAGEKITNGKRTGKKCVVVGVLKKKDVPEKDMIPRDISGIPTDIIETQPFYAL